MWAALKCDLYQCLRYSGVHANVGCTNVTSDPTAACTPCSDVFGSISYLSNNTPANKKQSGQSWYARMSDEKKAEYIQKQRLARQKKRSSANTADVSQIQGTSTSNKNMQHAEGT
jgi:hypothetical protein